LAVTVGEGGALGAPVFAGAAPRGGAASYGSSSRGFGCGELGALGTTAPAEGTPLAAGTPIPAAPPAPVAVAVAVAVADSAAPGGAPAPAGAPPLPATLDGAAPPAGRSGTSPIFSTITTPSPTTTAPIASASTP
jgi:hypothetical protein